MFNVSQLLGISNSIIHGTGLTEEEPEEEVVTGSR